MPALYPLGALPLFASHDGELHLWRLWEYWELWRTGQIPPRWAPDFVYGYGVPLFLYYNPLPYVLGSAALGWGLGAAAAMKILFGLSLIASFVGAWLFAVEWAGDKAGWRVGILAGATYVYFPYHLVDVYVRGALAEALALGIAPFLCWVVCRYARTRGRGWLSALALLVAALLLTHTVSSLIYSAPLGLLALLTVYRHSRGGRSPGKRSRGGHLARGLLGLLGAALLGLGLASFHQGPAALEQAYVQFDQATRNHERPESPKFLAHLVPLHDLVQPSLVHDYSRDFPADSPHAATDVPSLGLWSLGLLAAGAVWAIRRDWLRADWPLLALAILVLWLATPLAAPVWTTAPLLPLVQFPWRFFGPFALFGAALAGQLGRVRAIGDPIVLLLVLLSIVVAGVGSLRPAPIEWDRARERWSDAIGYERRFKTLGMMMDYEFMPNWVTPDRWHVAIAGPPIASDFGSVDLSLLSATVARREFRARSAGPSRLILDSLYFPTWTARLDGQPWPTYPLGPLGLLAVDLPPGEHQVEVALETTTTQKIAGLISLATLGLWLVLAWSSPRARSRLLYAALPAAVIFAPLALAAIRPAAGASWRPASDPASLSTADAADEARVLAYRADDRWLAECGLIEVSLMLHSRQRFAASETLAVELVDPHGRSVVTDMHLPNLATRPTTGWIPGLVLVDRMELGLPPGLAAGEYGLRAALGKGPAVDVGSIRLTEPSGACERRRLVGPPGRRDATLGALVLDNVETDTPPETWRIGLPLRRAEGGQVVRYRLSWRRLTDGRAEVHLRLVDKQGSVVATHVWPALEAASTRFVTEHELPIPEGLHSDAYRVEVLARPPGGDWHEARAAADRPTGAALPLELIQVGLPGGEMPSRALTASVDFEDGIRLLGYAKALAGRTLTVDLYWQATRAPSADYTVFVHALDRQDNLLAQWDGPPQGGAASTSTWQPGEVIGESYHLLLPPAAAGPVLTRVGLYRPADVSRLRTAGGSDHYFLGAIGAPPHRRQAVDLDDGISLEGSALRATPGGAEVVLIWTARGRPSREYQVFVHLLDLRGRVVAQGDGPPEDGMRKTAEWPRGETIVDVHPLSVPAGLDRGRIVVGMYRLADGTRLSRVDGGDAIDLGELAWTDGPR